MSVKTLAEAEGYGYVHADGRISVNGQLVTLTEMRRRTAESNQSVRYADSHDGGSDEPWETPQ